MKLTIGIPMLCTPFAETYASTIKLGVEMSQKGEVFIANTIDLCPYDRAREVIVTTAIKNGSDFLFFQDADTFIPPGAFTKMWDALHEKKAVMVTGRSKKRGYPYTNTWSKRITIEDNTHVVTVEAKEGVHEIDRTGLFASLIDLRWVKENLQSPFFRYGVDAEGVKYCEDLYFCDKITSAGGKIFGVGEVYCKHLYRRVWIDDDADDLRKGHLLENPPDECIPQIGDGEG